VREKYGKALETHCFQGFFCRGDKIPNLPAANSEERLRVFLCKRSSRKQKEGTMMRVLKNCIKFFDFSIFCRNL
jgi:hypothetical protein